MTAWLDAKYAAARGHCDAIIDPFSTRRVLQLALDLACAHDKERSFILQTARRPGIRRGAMIRIANGQGFWGDWLEAPVRLVNGGPLDYLTLDYLAEVTMSILQKQRKTEPALGYARDFPPLIGGSRSEIKAGVFE